MTNKSVEIIEIMDNGITSLGCEFLARVLKKETESPITTLKLDHNPLGSEGVINLCKGLDMNPILKVLSLNYCEIGKEAAKSISNVIIYIKSEMKEISLKGNNLENEGVGEILKAVQISKNLLKIDLADNKVKEAGDTGVVVEQICKAVTVEDCPVKSYDLSYNNFDDAAADLIVSRLELGGLVPDFKLTIKMNDDLLSKLKDVLVKNKKSAKKSKKGKKGKKKGKKKK